jgi:glyoxylase-like metal-dependent hydrolase (beta-lactamase superfamily II)
MQLAPSLHRLGGSTVVNSYLVADATGVTLIDAGLPGYWSHLPDELAAMGRSIEDLRGVVLTHGDTDHVGFAERLRRERGVPVYVHQADAARARFEVKKPSSGWGPVKVGALLGFLWYSARNGALRIPPLSEVVPFDDGATLDLPGSPRVVHLPGHTPGSAAIHVPAVDALFVGDALTTRNVLTGETGPRIAPFTLDPDGARSSWARLDGIDARWMLVGHGDPWDGGVGEALRQARAR